MSAISEKTATTVPMTVWYSPESGEICLARPTDRTFFTTVHADPVSRRGHPALFRELAILLRDAGLPHPDIEGRMN